MWILLNFVSSVSVLAGALFLLPLISVNGGMVTVSFLIIILHFICSLGEIWVTSIDFWLLWP